MQPINIQKQHRNNFDFLRLLFALLVIFTHSFCIYYGLEKFPEPLYQWSHKQINFGNLAVNFFFVISGYLVTESWFRSKNVFDFLKKRIFRIYPAFIVVCLFLVFVAGPLGNASYSNSWDAYFKYLRNFDFGYFPHTIYRLKEPLIPLTFINQPLPFGINGSLWTISHEFICYLILMVLGLFGFLKSKKLIIVVFVISYSMMLYFQYFNTEWVYKVFPGDPYNRLVGLSWLFAFFMMGVIFYTWKNLIKPLNWLLFLSPILFLLAARYTQAVLSVQLFLGSYVMFCFAFSKKIQFYKTARYGDFSYGLYLYGWPIQQLIVFFTGTSLTYAGSYFMSMAFIIPCAVASWYLVERPFIKFKNFQPSWIKNLPVVNYFSDRKNRIKNPE